MFSRMMNSMAPFMDPAMMEFVAPEVMTPKLLGPAFGSRLAVDQLDTDDRCTIWVDLPVSASF